VNPRRAALLIESVTFVCSRAQRCGCDGSSEESFLELMPQLLGERDFGIACEARGRFDTSFVVVRLHLGHDRVGAYRVPAMKYPFKTDHESQSGRMKRPLHVKIHNSAARKLVSAAWGLRWSLLVVSRHAPSHHFGSSRVAKTHAQILGCTLARRLTCGDRRQRGHGERYVQ
jgi:hypothetical protein